MKTLPVHIAPFSNIYAMKTIGVHTAPIRGAPDQDFQNPAGTGFTGFFRGVLPDNPAGNGLFYVKCFSLAIRDEEW